MPFPHPRFEGEILRLEQRELATGTSSRFEVASGPVFGGRAQNGLGWLGLQKAAYSMPEESVPFCHGPTDCAGAANI